jgi:hypothetical protein
VVPTLSIRPLPLLGSRQNYRPMPWGPAPMSEKAMGQTGAVVALGVAPMLISAGIGGLIAWAGYSWASKSEETLPKVLGYALTAIGGLGAIGGLLGAVLWTTGVYAVKEAAAASDQRSTEFFQRANTDFMRTTQQNRAAMDQFMNQQPSQPSTTEQFSAPLTLPTTPILT